MTNILTIEEILKEVQEYEISSDSANASFTLDDILKQPADDAILEITEAQLNDDQGMFQLDDDEGMFDGLDNQTNTPSSQLENHDGQRDNLIPIRGANNNPILNKQINLKTSVELKPVSRCTRLKDFALPALKQITNMSFTILKNVTTLFDSNGNKGVGIPTAIQSTGNKFLAIGTSLGNIAIFEVGVKNHKILGTPELSKYGQITSLSISRDNKYLVAGHQMGVITLWDLYYFSLLKQEITRKCKILKVLFCSESIDFLVNDIQGNVSLYTIQKYIWVNLKQQKLFETTSTVYLDIKTHCLESKRQIIALTTFDEILIISIKPNIAPMHKLIRPEGVYLSKIPNIQLGKCELLNIESKKKPVVDVICVSWANTVYIYKFVLGNSIFENLEILYKFEQDSHIFNMQFITDSILVILDNRQNFRTYKILIGEKNEHYLINQTQLPEEIIYQRFIRSKNNKYIKSFNNTIINCSFNPKEKQLFFICKNSIFRSRLHKWTDYINDLINNQKKYLESLKISIQLFKGNLDIFIEKIVLNERILKKFCEMGQLYLQERMKQLVKLNQKEIQNQIASMYEILIEYMLQIDSLSYLFEDIYKKYIKVKAPSYIFPETFLDCLEPFIEKCLIKTVPSVSVFREIVEYFSEKKKTKLLDIFFMSLDVGSIYYEDAVQICTLHRLYNSLAYVCSTHNDYISPANKILNACKDVGSRGMQNAERQYYLILNKYLSHLLQNKYINENQINKAMTLNIKMNLSAWLICQETSQFFTTCMKGHCKEDYFQLIDKLVDSVLDQENWEKEESKDHVHQIIQMIIENDKTQQKIHVADLIIKICHKIDLTAPEIEIVLKSNTLIKNQNHLIYSLQFVYKYYQQIQNSKLLRETQRFIKKNVQLTYFYYFISSSSFHFNSKNNTQMVDSKINTKIVDQKINEQSNLINGQNNKVTSKPERMKLDFNLNKITLPKQNDPLSNILTKFIFDNANRENIDAHIEELLKIHSQNTLIYMLQKCSIEEVNSKIELIKDVQCKYFTIRKLLKKLRSDRINKATKKNKKKQVEKESLSSSNRDSSLSSSSSQSKEKQKQIPGNKVESKLSKGIMKFYLECLCLFKKQKRIYYEFIGNMQDYVEDVDETLQIIKKYSKNNYQDNSKEEKPSKTLDSSEALLYQYKKQYMTAYDYFFRVYNYYFFEENYKKIMSYKYCHGRFIRKIFQKMLKICEIVDKEEQWMDLLSKVISPLEKKSLMNKKQTVCNEIQHVSVKLKDHPFLNNLSEIIELCLINVSSKVHISIISKFIGDHSSLFNKTFILHSFGSTLSTYSKNAYIYVLANEMLEKDQTTELNRIYQNKIQGLSVSKKCQKCKKQIQLEDSIKIFHCAHCYHINCVQKSQREDEPERCEVCISLQTGNAREENLSKYPDFSIREGSNLLVKGIKAIWNVGTTVGTTVLNVIPNAFIMGASKETEQVKKQDGEQENEDYEDEAYEYIAFENNLEKEKKTFDQFMEDYNNIIRRSLSEGERT